MCVPYSADSEALCRVSFPYGVDALSLREGSPLRDRHGDLLTVVFASPCAQVPVQSWFDDMNDSELLDLLPFFEGLSKEDEVYGVLQDLRGR